MEYDYKEWQKLCDEHQKARDAVTEALGRGLSRSGTESVHKELAFQ